MGLRKYPSLSLQEIEIIEMAADGFAPQSIRYQGICRQMADCGLLQQIDGGAYIPTGAATTAMRAIETEGAETPPAPKKRRQGRRTLDRLAAIAAIVQGGKGLTTEQRSSWVQLAYLDLGSGLHLHLKTDHVSQTATGK